MKVCAVLAALTAGACTSALADVFDFSYTGSGITASGTLTGTATGNLNEYLINAISGTRNSSGITGLVSAGTCSTDFGIACDNLFYFPPYSGGLYFSGNGIGFSTADGTVERLYSAGGGTGNYEGANPGSGTTVITFDANAVPAPIPGAGALSYLLVLLGGAVRWRKALVARVRSAAISARHWARACYRRIRPAALLSAYAA